MAGRGSRRALVFVVVGLVGAAAVALWLLADPGAATVPDASSQGASLTRESRDAASRDAGSSASGGSAPASPGTGGLASGATGEARERLGSVQEGQQDPPLSPAERAEAERISFEMTKFVRDLEYTPGLGQPPVSVVRPYDEPWRPDPTREGPAPVIDAFEPGRGRTAGGDRVLVRGKNLRVVQVMFGTAPGRILTATGTLVTVAAPASTAGPVKIAVTNDDGTWAIAPEPFVYAE